MISEILAFHLKEHPKRIYTIFDGLPNEHCSVVSRNRGSDEEPIRVVEGVDLYKLNALKAKRGKERDSTDR